MTESPPPYHYDLSDTAYISMLIWVHIEVHLWRKLFQFSVTFSSGLVNKLAYQVLKKDHG